MSYATFWFSFVAGFMLIVIGIYQTEGDRSDEIIAIGGKTMLGGAILACCIKYLFA